MQNHVWYDKDEDEDAEKGMNRDWLVDYRTRCSRKVAFCVDY
jgi:hypothetical protein